MFNNEQCSKSKVENLSKKRIWRIGTPFVKPIPVRRSFTYKEVSLIAGILVALVIVFTIWFRQDSEKQPSSRSLKDKALQSLGDTAKSFVTKKFVEIGF
jgi:hypothetical protein